MRLRRKRVLMHLGGSEMYQIESESHIERGTQTDVHAQHVTRNKCISPKFRFPQFQCTCVSTTNKLSRSTLAPLRTERRARVVNRRDLNRQEKKETELFG